MTAFWTPTRVPADEVRNRFWQNKMEVLINVWPDGRTVRLSTHFYTTENEINQIVHTLPEVFTRC
jgi:selenocysteine lyase/cysteine desulfurase